ncbi:hypothetical protein ACP4OV_003575 [Aristida adscensionis]
MAAAAAAATPDALAVFASRLAHRRHRAQPNPIASHPHREARASGTFRSSGSTLCAAGSGTRSSGCWRPRFPPAETSPRCSPRARRPGACCAPARRGRSRRRRMGGGGSPSPTSSRAPSPSSATSRSCLAMRYEALVLRDAKYSDDLQLRVSHEEWLTFAKDSLDNGFYTIASKAFANALAHIHPCHQGQVDSSNSIAEDNTNDITGLQNLAKSLSAQHSVQTQSAEYMRRRASGVHEKCSLQSGKQKLLGSSMFRLGIKTRNIKNLLRSRQRNSGEI